MNYLVVASAFIFESIATNPAIEVRAVDGSPCINTRCFLGSTIVINHKCATSLECESLQPVFNKSATITVTANLAQSQQVTPALERPFTASITCDQLKDNYRRVNNLPIAYSFAEFIFMSEQAGSTELSVTIDSKCVLNSDDGLGNEQVDITVFQSSCSASTTTSGACWAIKYGPGNTQNYEGQVATACRGATEADYRNGGGPCMNNISLYDNWAPVLMFADPHDSYISSSSSYDDFFFYGRGDSNNDQALKLFFNEPVSISHGKICHVAYKASGEHDPDASICYSADNTVLATRVRVSSSGFIVNIPPPVVSNRFYSLLIETDAIKDKSNNYFPGINGGNAATASDNCATSRKDDVYKWPARGLVKNKDSCRIAYVRAGARPVVTYPPIVMMDQVPRNDEDLKFFYQKNNISTPNDASLCFKFTEDSTFKGMNSGSSKSNPAYRLVTNFSTAMSPHLYNGVQNNCTLTQLSSLAVGIPYCSFSWFGATQKVSPSVPVRSQLMTSPAAQCWTHPDGLRRCCNSIVKDDDKPVFKLSLDSIANLSKLIIAPISDGSMGYTGMFDFMFWVKSNNSGKIDRPSPVWITWEGRDINFSAGEVIEVDSLLGIASLGVAGSAYDFNSSVYNHGIHIQWNRAVRINTNSAVHFVPSYYLQGHYSVKNLTIEDYFVSSSATPGCGLTNDQYSSAFGKPCLIRSNSSLSINPPEFKLYSSDHMVVNPRELIPGSIYHVIIEDNFVYGFSPDEFGEGNQAISFSVKIKQSINWGSAEVIPSVPAVSPSICCSVPDSSSPGTGYSDMTDIYSKQDAGFVHHTQAFMTTFNGPVVLNSSGLISLECGNGAFKEYLPVEHKDVFIVRGKLLFIEPSIGGKSLFFDIPVGDMICCGVAQKDSIMGVSAGTRITPYFRLQHGDKKSPELIEVSSWAFENCSVDSNPPCVTQAALSDNPARKISTYNAYDAESVNIKLTFDEMVRLGECDITLSTNASISKMSRKKFVWSKKEVSSDGIILTGLSPFSSETNEIPPYYDGNASSPGASARVGISSIRVQNYLQVETTTESGLSSVPNCDGDFDSTDRGYCTSPMQRSYEYILVLPNTKLQPGVLWNLDIPRCAFYDWARESTGAINSNMFVSGNESAWKTSQDQKTVRIPIMIDADIYAPNITYSPCGSRSKRGPQGRKVKGHCYHFGNIDVTSTTSPSYYEIPKRMGQFEFQGPLTGLTSQFRTAAQVAEVPISNKFPYNRNIKQVLPVMLEFDEEIVMDKSKKCALIQSFLNHPISNSDTVRYTTLPLYTGYQSSIPGKFPNFFVGDPAAGNEMYPNCDLSGTVTRTSPCQDPRGDIIVSNFEAPSGGSATYKWLTSLTHDDVKPDSVSATESKYGTWFTPPSAEFNSLDYFTLGNQNIVQYNGSYSYCVEESFPDFCLKYIKRSRLFFFLQFVPHNLHSVEIKKSFFRLSCEAGAFKDRAGNIADQKGVDYRFTFFEPENKTVLNTSMSYPILSGTTSKSCTNPVTCFESTSSLGGPSVTNQSNILWTFSEPVQFQPYNYDSNMEWASLSDYREIDAYGATINDPAVPQAAEQQLYAVFYDGRDILREATVTGNDISSYSECAAGLSVFGSLDSALATRFSRLCVRAVSLSEYLIISEDSKRVVFSTRISSISNYNTGLFTTGDLYEDSKPKFISFVAPKSLFGSGVYSDPSKSAAEQSLVTAYDSDPSTLNTPWFNLKAAASYQTSLIHKQLQAASIIDDSWPASDIAENDLIQVTYGFFDPFGSRPLNLKPEILMVLPGAIAAHGFMNTDGVSYSDKNRYNIDPVTNKLNQNYDKQAYGGGSTTGNWAASDALAPRASKAFKQVLFDHSPAGFRIGLIMSEPVSLSNDVTKRLKIYDCGEYVRLYQMIVYDPNCNQNSASATISGNWAAPTNDSLSSSFPGTFSAGDGITADNRAATVAYEVNANGFCQAARFGNAECVTDIDNIYISSNDSVGLNSLIGMVIVSTPAAVSFAYNHKYTLHVDAGFFVANNSFTSSVNEEGAMKNVEHTGLTLSSDGESQADTTNLVGSRIDAWYIRESPPKPVKVEPENNAHYVDQFITPVIWFDTAMSNSDDFVLPMPSVSEGYSSISALIDEVNNQPRKDAHEVLNQTVSAKCAGFLCTLYPTYSLAGSSGVSRDSLIPGKNYSLEITQDYLYDSNLQAAFIGYPGKNRSPPDNSLSFRVQSKDILPPFVLYCCVISPHISMRREHDCDIGLGFDDLAKNISTKAGDFRFKCIFSEAIVFGGDSIVGSDRYFKLENLGDSELLTPWTDPNDLWNLRGCAFKQASNFEDPDTPYSGGSDVLLRARCQINGNALIVETGENMLSGTRYNFFLDKIMIRDMNGNTMNLDFNSEVIDISGAHSDDHSFTAVAGLINHPEKRTISLNILTGSDYQQEQCYNCTVPDDFETASDIYASQSNTLRLLGFTDTVSGSYFTGCATNMKGWPDMHINTQAVGPDYLLGGYDPNSSPILSSIEASFLPTDRILLRFNRQIQPYLLPGQVDLNGLSFESWIKTVKFQIQDCGPDMNCEASFRAGKRLQLVPLEAANSAGYSYRDRSNFEVIYGYDSILLNPGGRDPVKFTPGHFYQVKIPPKIVKMGTSLKYGSDIYIDGGYSSGTPNYMPQTLKFLVSSQSEDRRIYSPLGTSTAVDYDTLNHLGFRVYDPYPSIKRYILDAKCDKILALISDRSDDPGTTPLMPGVTKRNVRKDQYIWFFFPEHVRVRSSDFHVFLNKTEYLNVPDDSTFSHNLVDGVYPLTETVFTRGYYFKIRLNDSVNVINDGSLFTLGIQTGALFTAGGNRDSVVPNPYVETTLGTTPLEEFENVGLGPDSAPKYIWSAGVSISQCFSIEMSTGDLRPSIPPSPALTNVFPTNETLDVHLNSLLYLEFNDTVSLKNSSLVKLSECGIRSCEMTYQTRSTSDYNELANFINCCDAMDCVDFFNNSTMNNIFWQTFTLDADSDGVVPKRTRFYINPMNHIGENRENIGKSLNPGKCYVFQYSSGLVTDQYNVINNDSISFSPAAHIDNITSTFPQYWFRTGHFDPLSADYTQLYASKFDPQNGTVNVQKFGSMAITFNREIELLSPALGVTSLRKSIYIRYFDNTLNSKRRKHLAPGSKRYIDCSEAPAAHEVQYIIDHDGDDYTRGNRGPFHVSKDSKTLRIYPSGFKYNDMVACLVISQGVILDTKTRSSFRGLYCGEYCFTTEQSGSLPPRILDHFPRRADDMSVKDILNWDGNMWFMFDRGTIPDLGYITFGTASAALLPSDANNYKMPTSLWSPYTNFDSASVAGTRLLGYAMNFTAYIQAFRATSRGHGQPVKGVSAGAYRSWTGKKSIELPLETNYKIVREMASLPTSDNMIKASFVEVDQHANDGKGGVPFYARSHSGSIYCNDTLFIVGGLLNGTLTDEVCTVHDPTQNLRESLRPPSFNNSRCRRVLGMKRLDPKLACVRMFVYVIGGGGPLARTMDFGETWQILDQGANSSNITSQIGVMNAFSSNVTDVLKNLMNNVSLNNSMFGGVLGILQQSIGLLNSPYSVFSLQSVPYVTNGVWYEDSTFPEDLSGAAVAVFGGWQLVICGGGLETCWLCVDLDCRYWQRGATVPDAIRHRYGGTLTYAGHFTSKTDFIYMLGGKDAEGVLFNDMWMTYDSGINWICASADLAADGIDYLGNSFTIEPREGSCILSTNDNMVHLIAGSSNSSEGSMKYFNDYYTSYLGRIDYFDSSLIGNELYVGGGGSPSNVALGLARPRVIGYSPARKSQVKLSDKSVIEIIFSEKMDEMGSKPSSRLIWLCMTESCSSKVGDANAISQNTRLSDNSNAIIGVCNATSNSGGLGKGCCRTVELSNDAHPRPIVGSGMSSSYLRKADLLRSTPAAVAEYLSGPCDDYVHTVIDGAILRIEGLNKWERVRLMPSDMKVYVFIPEGSVFDNAGNTIYYTSNYDIASGTSTSTKPTIDRGFEYYFSVSKQSPVAPAGSFPAHADCSDPNHFITALDTRIVVKFNERVKICSSSLPNSFLKISSSWGYRHVQNISIAVRDAIILNSKSAIFPLGSNILIPGHKYTATLSANSFVGVGFDENLSQNLSHGNSEYSFTFCTSSLISHPHYNYPMIGYLNSAYSAGSNAKPSCLGSSCFLPANNQNINCTTNPIRINASSSFPSNRATSVMMPSVNCSMKLSNVNISQCLAIRVVWTRQIKVNSYINIMILQGSTTQLPSELGVIKPLYTLNLSDIVIDEGNMTIWSRIGLEANMTSNTWHEIVFPTGVITAYNSSNCHSEYRLAFKTAMRNNTQFNQSRFTVAHASIETKETNFVLNDFEQAKCLTDKNYCVPVNNHFHKQIRIVMSQPLMLVNVSANNQTRLNLIWSSYDKTSSLSIESGPIFYNSTDGVLYATLNDSYLLQGLFESPLTCVLENEGCLGQFSVFLPENFIVSNLNQSAPKYNSSVLNFYTHWFQSLTVLNMFPVPQGAINYHSNVKNSTLAIQFDSDIMLSDDQDAGIKLTAMSSPKYNNRVFNAYRKSKLIPVGSFLVIDEELMPGESYVMSLWNRTVRDNRGYFLHFNGEGASTNFGVVPMVRFRQNYKVAASNELPGVDSEECDYAADLQAQSAKCIGFTPRSFFGICATNRKGDIIVGGGKCEFCGSFARENDGLGRSASNKSDASVQYSDVAFVMSTHRPQNSQGSGGPWTICNDVCSATELSSSTFIISQEPSSVSGSSWVQENKFNTYTGTRYAPFFAGSSKTETCRSRQCMNCVSAPKFTECDTSVLLPNTISADSFNAIPDGTVVKAFGCLPGLHAVGTPTGQRNVDFTCKARSFGYKWQFEVAPESSICSSKPFNPVCERDYCEVSGENPNENSHPMMANSNQIFRNDSLCISSGMRMYGDVCHVQCAPGFEKRNSTASYTLRCVANLTTLTPTPSTYWAPFVDNVMQIGVLTYYFSCKPRTCSPIKNVKTSLYDSSYTQVDSDYIGEKQRLDVKKSCTDSGISYGQYCMAKCAPGYTAGNNTRYLALKCDVDTVAAEGVSIMTYNGGISCEKLRCSTDLPQLSLQQLNCSSGDNYGATCTTVCAKQASGDYIALIGGARTSANVYCACKDADCQSLAFAERMPMPNDITGGGVSFTSGVSLCEPKTCSSMTMSSSNLGLFEELLTPGNGGSYLDYNSLVDPLGCARVASVGESCVGRCRKGYSTGDSNNGIMVPYRCVVDSGDVRWQRDQSIKACQKIPDALNIRRSERITQKMDVVMNFELTDYNSTSEFFARKRAAITDSLCHAMTTSAFKLVGKICLPDYINEKSNQGDYCFSNCTVCMSCGVCLNSTDAVCGSELGKSRRLRSEDDIGAPKRSLREDSLAFVLAYYADSTIDDLPLLEKGSNDLIQDSVSLKDFASSFIAEMGLRTQTVVASDISITGVTKNNEKIAASALSDNRNTNVTKADDNSTAYVILGASVGGLLLLGLLAMLINFLCRKKSR